jgi:chromosome partitioning protein
MRIISFLSQKGGVGKSTACVNLATALAERHYRVLLVDLDTNACASRLFGVVAAMENSVVAALIGEQPLASLIQPTGLEGIWLVPGSTVLGAIHDLPVAKPETRGEDGHLSDEALAVELENLGQDHFDFIFVDCPGGQVFMEQLSLLACDEVVVPTGLSVFDLFAATPTLQLITMAQSIRGGQPDFLGFLPTGTSSAGVPRRIQAELDAYRLPCFTPIRHSALMRTIVNAPDVRQRVILNARPDSAVAASYRQVAREIELGIKAARNGLPITAPDDDLSDSPEATALSLVGGPPIT